VVLEPNNKEHTINWMERRGCLVGAMIGMRAREHRGTLEESMHAEQQQCIGLDEEELVATDQDGHVHGDES
jgi:hypothetical protein